jgi:hypothetical protein
MISPLVLAVARAQMMHDISADLALHGQCIIVVSEPFPEAIWMAQVGVQYASILAGSITKGVVEVRREWNQDGGFKGSVSILESPSG